MHPKIASRIVNAIFNELEGRSGFDMLNIIHDDTEVYDEMHAACVEKVIAAFGGESGEFDHHWEPKKQP